MRWTNGSYVNTTIMLYRRGEAGEAAEALGNFVSCCSTSAHQSGYTIRAYQIAQIILIDQGYH
jgi:hypothetical protein